MRRRRVIVGIDNSAVAQPVLATATWLAGVLGAEVDAVHVQEDGTRTVDAEADAAGVSLRRLHGDPERVLAAELVADDVVLAVVGSRCRPGGARPAGHVATSLLQHTSTPLVVVPPECRDPFRQDPARLLVPLDGSELTAATLEHTIDLFGSAGLTIVVLHVFEPTHAPRFWDQAQHAAPSWAEEFRRRNCAREDVHVHLRTGAPAEQVLEVARSEAATMIALGWSQDLSEGRAEVVREALAWSPVPVLLVPSPVVDVRDGAGDRTQQATHP